MHETYKAVLVNKYIFPCIVLQSRKARRALNLEHCNKVRLRGLTYYKVKNANAPMNTFQPENHLPFQNQKVLLFIFETQVLTVDEKISIE